MSCEEVNERLVCCTPLAGNDGGPSYGFRTFQETLEFPQLGSVIELSEIFSLLSQILA